MRCRDAKQVLLHQRDSVLTDSSAATELEEHLQQCSVCRAFEQHQHSIDALLKVPSTEGTMRSRGRISTGSIMLAVQQQKQISQQLETIHQQQRCRVARLRKGGLAFAALTFFTLGSIPLLLLAITLVQTDLMVNILFFLRSLVDVLYVLVQYLLMGLTIVTRNSLLLSGVAFAVVLMTGMWLRLMRSPQEV